MKNTSRICLSLAVILLPVAALPAAELVTLTPENWDEFAPAGKEVDCIYGDYVLRNGRLVAVVARPVAGRNANMTVRDTGGGIIDLTRRDRQSDQLSAYYPGARQFALRFAGVAAESPAVYEASDLERTSIRAKSVSLRCAAEPAEGKPAVEVRYTLRDGERFVLVETAYTNPGEQPIEVELRDAVRADRSFEKAPDGRAQEFWAYDKWFGQAYGIDAGEHEIESTSDGHNSELRYLRDGESKVTLGPGETHRLARRVYPGADLFEVRAIGQARPGKAAAQGTIELVVKDTAGNPVADADVVAAHDGSRYAWGRTNSVGQLRFALPAAKHELTVSALGRGSKTLEVEPGETYTVELDEPGYVAARISDADGAPIPCKVQFRGKDGTEDPFFGPDSGEHAVHNLYYSHDGRFRQIVLPGKYDVIVSHGTEYDAVFTEIEVARGQDTPLEATLVRSVQTAGWVSSDFHSHSSPSGDNTSSQYGRVLNLLCEHIEFAPCTEHNRLSTYVPHLKRLGVVERMATCVGIELTSSPGSANHHNAFPLVRKPRTQDGGAPLTDLDPEVQIERLALWDGGSEKLVQQNHPDIGRLFFDKNADGTPDGGYSKMFGFMDVIEVHPPQSIFDSPLVERNGKLYNNSIVNWLQLVNQGHRIPGVVNTDAHYNFHGSGFLRNYLKSPTDDPARIETMDMVHAAEHGNLIMTNGPFLEVRLRTADGSEAIAGDDVTATDGKATLHVRVQCPNWFDVDRVQVLLNGRAEEKLNFTRQAAPDRFGSEVVKFDQQIPLDLAGDAHVILVAIGEQSQLGPVMGPRHQANKPTAVSNPIFVDVDGGGFKANGDTLGAPLPVVGGRPAGG